MVMRAGEEYEVISRGVTSRKAAWLGRHGAWRRIKTRGARWFGAGNRTDIARSGWMVVYRVCPISF